MKILIALTYYRPHVSGLTIYVERLARALADFGHRVTILTSQYEPTLPRIEKLNGIHVLRVPVAFRVSKGVVMPSLGIEATRQVLAHDVLSLHLPQFDAAGIAFRGRLFRRPVTLTYHCDLRLPTGIINRVANHAVEFANRLAATFADRVIAYTEDFALNSPFLSRYQTKLHVIPPPVEVHAIETKQVERFIQERRKLTGPVIGMASRLATEKGVEYLLEALDRILERHPEAEVLFAGQFQDVLGEEAYAHQLAPMLERYRKHWTFLGVLEPNEMASFFQACDVTVLPSVNSTESFGLVQIESMMCGTPVVASNLPGVRQPVMTTGMGKIIPLRNPIALAEAVLEVLEKSDDYQIDVSQIIKRYSPDRVAAEYEALFENLLTEKRK